MSLLVHPVMENAEGVENGKQMELKMVSVASSRSGGPYPLHTLPEGPDLWCLFLLKAFCP